MVDPCESVVIDEHSVEENLALPRKLRRQVGETNDSLQTAAMKLNNKGALCIQRTDYKQAIFMLSRALKIAEKVSHVHANESTPCDCYHCKLESCMMNDPWTQSNVVGNRNRKDLDTKQRKSRVSGSLCQRGFLYTRPLFASLLSIREGHFMGETLSIMVLFNLALAYHLEGTLSRAMKLYELCYRLQLQSSQRSCLWFSMCISNNLSEIHRCEGNSQYSACLSHLLSTMMYVVDCHMVSSSSAMTGVDMISHRLRCADFHQYMMKIAMDGFLRNSFKMILCCRVASAA